MTEHVLNLPTKWPPTDQSASDQIDKKRTPKLNRREFLVYAWSAAVALAMAQGAAGVYLFMRPRFSAGEFGGRFDLGEAGALPPTSDAPQGHPAGKFWLVNTEQGPRALYMVCTHLGCLYKWNESDHRFECPCHNSMFSREGELINGPATRGLDQFVVQVLVDEEVVGQTEDGETTIYAPANPPDNSRLVVDTGKRILGKP